MVKDHLTDRITHTTAFVTPVVEHWLERDLGSGLDLRFRLGLELIELGLECYL